MRVLGGSGAARALEGHALITGQGLLELGEMCGQRGWCLCFSHGGLAAATPGREHGESRCSGDENERGKAA